MKRDVTLIARRYRAAEGKQFGVVVLYDEVVAGWMDKLRAPRHWMPGCIAVDDDGRQWVARGGNDRDGAESWVLLEDEK